MKQDEELQRLLKAVAYSPGPIPNVSEVLEMGKEKGKEARVADDEGLEEDMLAGRPVPGSALREPSRIVRFFLSSTFTDTRLERDLMIAAVMPRVREYCQSVGLQLELSEMRWGVNDVHSARHETAELCMAELDRCKEQSVAMNFIGILGSKYGYRPFPAALDVELYTLLRGEAESGTHPLLDTWFVHDENRGLYILRHVTDIIPDYVPSRSDAASAKWWQTFEQIQSVLRSASRSLLAAGRITPEQARLFSQSVTEEEMRRGLIKHSDTGRCLLVSRELEGVPCSDRAYTDGADDEARMMLGDLKKELRARLEPAGRFVEFNVPYRAGGLDPVLHPEHAAYLRSFLGEMESRIVQSIREYQARSHVRSSPLYDEVRRHRSFASSKVDSFVGRDDLVTAICESAQAHKLTFVQGPSGSGKTSAMATAAARLRDRLPAGSVLVERYVGVTADASTSVGLMRSLCYQLHDINCTGGGEVEEGVVLPQAMEDALGKVPVFLRDQMRKQFEDSIRASQGRRAERKEDREKRKAERRQRKMKRKQRGDPIEPKQRDDNSAIELPASFDELQREFFEKYLGKWSPSSPIFLFVDSLDQLVCENFTFMDPARIPIGCHVVVSSIYDFDCFYTTQVPCIDVPNLQTADVDAVLRQWLPEHRSLAAHQVNAVRGIVEQCETPTMLLLRILFNELMLVYCLPGDFW